MPDKVIVHVGPHKTGSTAIQRTLASERGALLEEGILYPRSGVIAAAHQAIFRYCRESSTTFEPAQLRAEATEASTVVVSSENFAVLDVAGLARLRAVLPRAPIRVIYYLRCLCDLWPSHWQDLVKHGMSWSFPEYVLRHAFGHGQHSWQVNNQFDQLSRLAAGFGKHSLEIVSYDRLRAEGTDIGQHFQTAVLGRERARVTGSSPVANVSLDPWQVELIRVLNAIHQSRVPGPASDMIRRLVLKRLQREEPPWIAEFKALVADAPRFQLSSDNPCVDVLQRRVLKKFSYAIADYETAEAAYMAPKQRLVPLLEWPLGARGRLRRALLDYHLDLIGASAEANRQPPSS